VGTILEEKLKLVSNLIYQFELSASNLVLELLKIDSCGSLGNSLQKI
jgi:hypothetical protein